VSTFENLYPQGEKIRLGRSAFISPAATCSVAVSTLNRAPVFRDFPFTEACIAALTSRAEKTGLGLHAHCFRAGIVYDWRAYPFCASLLHDL
jgi:hypothetical protein